jgi:hypothetical protein
MLDPDDLITYELCFPGAVTGSTEINCPHCDELLTAGVNDPMGEESCQVQRSLRGRLGRWASQV